MIKCKCYGCESRYLGCHANCEDYADYQEKLKKYNKKIKEEKERISSGWMFVHKDKRRKK